MRTEPKWMQEGLLIAGNWEPLAFRIRAGFARTDEKEWYDFEHSDESLEQLQKYGINLVITHFHKGFGLETEAEEISQTAKYIEKAHRRGIRIGVYIRFSDLNLETFHRQSADFKEWLQVGQYGNIEPYSYSQEFRGVICPTSQEYLNELKRVIDQAIKIKADLLHFDGFRWWMKEPCHCNSCKAEYKKFLLNKYNTKEKQFARFGHDQVDKIDIPHWPDRYWPDVIKNPAHQEWVEYRNEIFDQAHKTVCEYAYKKNDQIAIDFNCALPLEHNGFLMDGIDFSQTAPRSHILWSEHGHFSPSYHNQSKSLYTGMRHFRYCESLKNMCLQYIKGNTEAEAKRTFAETLAFNAGQGAMTCSQHVEKEPYRNMIKKWSDFYRTNIHLYMGSESLSKVAIVRHSPTLKIDSKNTLPQILLAEQMAIEFQKPYLNIFEITDKALTKFDLVILPNVVCMNSDEAKSIIKFVNNGGSVIVTGNTSLYDHWYRRHKDYLLREVLGDQIIQPEYDFKSFGELFHLYDDRNKSHGKVCRRYYGKGRVVYANKIEGESDNHSAGVREKTFWKSLFDWCLSKEQIKVEGPAGLIVEIRNQGAKTIIHLLNYTDAVLKNQVSITDKRGLEGRQIKIYDPDSGLSAVSISNAAHGAELIVPELQLYSIIEIV